MKETNCWNRRHVLGLALLPFAMGSRPSWAQSETISVFRDPSCGCCGGWVNHLREEGGLTAVVEERSDVDTIKRRLGVPEDLWSCHTAHVAGYAIEGHVPFHAVARLLRERPGLKGLAVPGMPIGSPGMEMEGREDPYDVIGFNAGQRLTFGRYRGKQPA